MSLSVKYESVNDAQMRLQHTVVLYDGEPVYITGVSQVGPDDPKDDIYRVYAAPLPFVPDRNGNQKEAFRKFISSRKFDLAPFPLGFMNKNDTTYYLSRQCKRQQKQGLSDNTIGVVDMSSFEGKGKGLPRRAFTVSNLVTYPEFLDTIKGRYPSLEEATALLQGDANAVAFSRVFALVKDQDLDDLIYLYHKTDKVGFILDGQLKLSKAARCLKEALQEVGIKCPN